MATASRQAQATTDNDRFQCEYVPFGAEEKIKLSFDLILKWLAVKTKQGASPSEQDLMKFLMTCKAKKLNPFDGDAFLVGYDGKEGPVFSTIVAHQAFLKRAETHPEFDGMESGVIVKMGDEIKELVGDFFPQGATLLGGWATVFFVNRRHPMTKRLKLSTFDKGRSLWKTNPEGMIVKCAEADALRSSFPQLIGGMYLREETQAHAQDMAAHRPLSLEDRRAEDIPAPFGNGVNQRPFADREGSTVNPFKAPRYAQDAAAADVAERIRPKPAAFHAEHVVPSQESSNESAVHEEARLFIYEDVMRRCKSVDSAAAGIALQKQISTHLTAKDITDEQACDLNAVLLDAIESLA